METKELSKQVLEKYQSRFGYITKKKNPKPLTDHHLKSRYFKISEEYETTSVRGGRSPKLGLEAKEATIRQRVTLNMVLPPPCFSVGMFSG